MHRFNHRMLILIGSLAAFSSPAHSAVAARDYPARTIRFVVPYAAGGGVDVVGRIIAQKMTPGLGQNIVLDNRGGAGGVIGSDVVAKAAPDGYTLLLTSSSYASLPYFVKNLPYDPVHDLLPVTLIAKNVGHVLAVNLNVPAQSVKELIALAKAQPGKLNYGSAGTGNVLHLAAEYFGTLTGTKMTHVQYKGVANAMTDLIAGQIEVCFPPAPVTLPFVQSGRVRALGITGARRWSQLPNVPTLDEAGVKGYQFVAWYGLWFPAGTPAEYVNRIQAEVEKAAKDPEVRQRYAEQGLEVVGSKPAEFGKAIQDELAFNRKLTAAIGIVPQ